MRIALKTLGCRLNEAEIQTWSNQFRERGLTIVNDETSADLLVLNTCAVTGDAVRKSRHLIRRCQRSNPSAKLVVSGCYTSLDDKVQTEIEGIDLVIANTDKDRLVDIASDLLDLPVMPSTATGAGETALFARNRSRAFIKIQDGCRYRCSFCIVTVARGEERSQSPESIIAQINAAHEQGVNEVVLTGVHAGGYGSDIGISLVALLGRVLSETDIPRIRMGSLEPWDLGDDFLELFANPRFMPHLHLPLQSGSDRILKRMARRCRTGDFTHLVNTLRQSVAGFQLTTDIIAGFPGETDTEWRETMDFVEATGFAHIHIFSYSPRAGTRAADMPDPVPREVIKARSHELHELMQRLKRESLAAGIGTRVDVLWESRSDDLGNTIAHYGYTPGFQRVETHTGRDSGIENTITPTRLTGINEAGDRLIGRIVPERDSSEDTGQTRQ